MTIDEADLFTDSQSLKPEANVGALGKDFRTGVAPRAFRAISGPLVTRRGPRDLVLPGESVAGLDADLATHPRPLPCRQAVSRKQWNPR